jgi:hypothetical protein
MANFAAWAPGLNLYKCQRTRDGYKAVAHWRPSSGGRPLEQREPNLSLHPTGIVDFGDGDRGYTPIDLYANARGIDPGEAFVELSKIKMGGFVVNLTPPSGVAAEPIDRADELLKLNGWASDEEEKGQGGSVMDSPKPWQPRLAVIHGLHDYRRVDDEITPTSSLTVKT